MLRRILVFLLVLLGIAITAVGQSIDFDSLFVNVQAGLASQFAEMNEDQKVINLLAHENIAADYPVDRYHWAPFTGYNMRLGLGLVYQRYGITYSYNSSSIFSLDDPEYRSKSVNHSLFYLPSDTDTLVTRALYTFKFIYRYSRYEFSLAFGNSRVMAGLEKGYLQIESSNTVVEPYGYLMYGGSALRYLSFVIGLQKKYPLFSTFNFGLTTRLSPYINKVKYPSVRRGIHFKTYKKSMFSLEESIAVSWRTSGRVGIQAFFSGKIFYNSAMEGIFGFSGIQINYTY